MLKIALAAGIASLTSISAAAEVSDSQWQQMMDRMALMESRIKTLEAENARLRTVGTVPVEDITVLKQDVAKLQEQNSASSWSENIRLKGDFRYRYEAIEVEDVDDRERNRVRGRLNLIANLPSNTEVGFGIATGGDDPVSTNQTLGNGGTSKGVRLNLAYFKWAPVDNLYVTAGKFSNPLFRPQKSQLLWDGDWTPEGVGLVWGGDVLFASAMGNWIESDTRNGDDVYAWSVQAGVKLPLGDSSFTAALAYHDVPVAGLESIFDDSFFGNTSVNNEYAYNYEMVELGAEFVFSLFDRPLSVFGNYVQNQDADDYDTGYEFGVNFGKASGPGTWQIGWRYEDLEADAVLGLLSDSDFAGGGTDAKGHRLSGAYGINKQWTAAFTWFIDNEFGETQLIDGPVDYDRLQLDLGFKY